MSSDTNVYNATIRLFGSHPDPAFESDQRQTSDWGRVWGCDNDVGALRLVIESQKTRVKCAFFTKR